MKKLLTWRCLEIADEEFGEVVQAVVQPANWSDATDDLARRTDCLDEGAALDNQGAQVARFYGAAAAYGQRKAL